MQKIKAERNSRITSLAIPDLIALTIRHNLPWFPEQLCLRVKTWKSIGSDRSDVLDNLWAHNLNWESLISQDMADLAGVP